jgi:ribonuclease D
MSPTIHVHQGDIPAGLTFPQGVAVDSETLGLKPHRDRLCVVQLSGGEGVAHLVQFNGKDYAAPRLRALLLDVDTVKIFHFARFDVAMFQKTFGIMTTPVFCTKIASKLARTYTDKHGLKDLAAELAGVAMDKQQQSSDWASATLSPAQRDYAASDVLHLHVLKARLEAMLVRDGRMAHAQACFDYLATRAELDLMGFDDMDIFAH